MMLAISTQSYAILLGDGERVYASLPRAAIQPCFYLERTTAESFRGSIAGLNFACCDFTRYQGRAQDIGEQKGTR